MKPSQVIARNLLTAALIGLAWAGVLRGDDYALASADRQRHAQDDWGYLYYLTTNANEFEHQSTVAGVTSFATASMSRQEIIEYCTPVDIGGGVSRINLAHLKWDAHEWKKFLDDEYPYGNYKFKNGELVKYTPLVVRADWLVTKILDEAESDIGPKLLYGTPPKDRDEFLEFWAVNNDKSKRWGLVEGNSGVAVAKVRWIEFRPVAIDGGWAYGTRDAVEIDDTTDPLEHLLGDQKHDAEEWLLSQRKVSIAAGKACTSMVGLLSNGEGVIQEKAPANIAVDHTGVRGVEVRNPLSCYTCHPKGINLPSTNTFKDYLAAGAIKYEKDKAKAQEIELFHLLDYAKTMARNQEDYELFIQVCNGWDGETNAKNLKLVVQTYDEPVTLERAAIELYTTAEELRLALAWASANYVELSGRLASLAHGKSMPRIRWEEGYVNALKILYLWEQATRVQYGRG